MISLVLFEGPPLFQRITFPEIFSPGVPGCLGSSMVLAVMEQSFLSLSHAVAASLKESALAGCLCLLIYPGLCTEIRGLAGRLPPRGARFFSFG